ncbi:MAG: bifunctional alpha/beta hydrolase/OsmC family protein [Pseudomonadota bacterium]
MATTSEAFSFQSASGAPLAGRLDKPAGLPTAYALFAHCFTCSKESIAATRISQALAERGIATLRFDFTGLGDSGGDFADTSFTSNVADLVAAAGQLRDQGMAPALLIGHSLGGAAVVAAAPQVPEAVGVITIGAPSDPKHVEHLLTPVLETVRREGVGEISLGGKSLRIGKGFLDDIGKHRLRDSLRGLGKAILILHSPSDEIVDVQHAGFLYKSAEHPKSYVSLDGANHLVTRRTDADYVASIIAAWAERYLPSTQVEAMPQGQVRVTETGGGRFLQQVTLGRHQLVADEPRDVGGLDAGPAPYDFLLAALGTCTAITLRLYAERKKLALEGVSIDLMHDRIHADDCATCETKEGRIDRIRRTLTFSGDLDEEARAALLRIADRCPVHQTLTHEVIIESELGSS